MSRRALPHSTYSTTVVADPDILKGVSASSSFIADAHNELYAFYMEKGG